LNTLFTEVRYDLGHLISIISLGELALPDIQRPFVWKNAKVRDLFDSMYKGYPIGYLLFWQSGADTNARQIGTNAKQKVPKMLIVDGQQRLTSLYAVINGIHVMRDNYESEAIEIAFSPLREEFAVADAAIRRDPTFIPNISSVWHTDQYDVVENYLASLGATRELSEDNRKLIKSSISRLVSIRSYPFTAVELSSTLDEEQVANIFVLINSAGKTLNQADFILTLMSVFWEDGRAALEAFCRTARMPSTGAASSFNHYITPDPDQLLRVAVGLGFRRARLKYVYSILRGKDLETDMFSDALRDAQFAVLAEAQSKVLNLQYWHDFQKVLLLAGYRSASMISSQTAVLYTYVFYLIGRTECSVPEHILRRALARWFFMSSMTGRYTSSPESTMDFDLARMQEVHETKEFLDVLERACDERISEDYWSLTLPAELATSAARSPALFAYFAALNMLEARALYSEHKVRDLMDPATAGQRNALERHHLFPKAYLKTLGITSTRETNQIANFALIEWGDNDNISDEAPATYAPVMEKGVLKRDLERMYYWHALPDGWATMDFQTFLQRRREAIAAVVRAAYELLAGAGASDKPHETPVAELIAGGESTGVEFKSTLRTNLHTRLPDPRIELSALKTIAGFLNGTGGTLVVGCDDAGEPIGLELDGFENEDKLYTHLMNLIRDRLSPQNRHAIFIHPRFEDIDGKRVLSVQCLAARSPVFVIDGPLERAYLRAGATTNELTASQFSAYAKERFL